MSDGFRTPHGGWWVAILAGMGLTAWIAFTSGGFGLWQDHVTEQLPQGLFQWIFWSALAAHAGEASYACKLARERDAPNVVRWSVQTFLLGYPSLRLLKQIQPKH